VVRLAGGKLRRRPGLLTAGPGGDMLKSMAALSRTAPAKINLTLRVTGVRSDGFHEIESLVALVTLHDTITIARRDDHRRLLQCDDPRLPCDQRNLALRAALELAAEFAITDGFELTLQKRIPLGAGLGGGSSDAATTLLLLDELWGLHLPRARLAQIAARVGSDVPLFMHGPVSIIRGRGEQVEPLNLKLPAHVLLLMPEMHSATAEVYRVWDSLPAHPPRPELGAILSNASSLPEFGQLLFNDLEEPALHANPELARLATEFRRILRCPLHMTGSGATFFCLLESAAAAQEAAGTIRKRGVRLRTEQVTFLAAAG
jgi:4-diphosphocytidyl-2-C-methyl-D-erythritol kinase